MKPYIETKFVSNRRMHSRPLTSRNKRMQPLKSDIVGQTIRGLKLHQPRVTTRNIYKNQGLNSQFTDRLIHVETYKTLTGRGYFKDPDLKNKIKKFNDKKAKKKLIKEVKNEVKQKKRREYSLLSPKMSVERRILGINCKRRDMLSKINSKVVLIQRYIRGFFARKLVKELKEKKRLAIILENAWVARKNKCKELYYSIGVKSLPISRVIEETIKKNQELQSEETKQENSDILVREKQDAFSKIDDMAKFFQTLKRQKLPELTNPPKVVQSTSKVDVSEEGEEESDKTAIKPPSEDSIKEVEQIFDEFQKQKAMEYMSEVSTKEKIISEKEMYNAFLKVDQNFDFKIDKDALKRVIQCRTELDPVEANGELQKLDLETFPQRARLKPMNMKEMETQVITKSQHCTFHTDSKLVKEFEINSIKPNGVLHSYISQEEKLVYEKYIKESPNPQSFVNWIIKNRRLTTPEEKTLTIYDYPSHMPYFRKIMKESQNYPENPTYGVHK
ncbi:unnamed protein product [Moneuplotes crassus]|uniref:EF-hand domain-containing protein n=1 Tax=Euplotes crassus TaxID=5936 RepID=A0AAD1X8T8_EUPCR|nr:unnamed protein product [Moneuplotes crassus]